MSDQMDRTSPVQQDDLLVRAGLQSEDDSLHSAAALPSSQLTPSSSRSLVKVFGRVRPFISLEKGQKTGCVETTDDTIYVSGDSNSRRRPAAFTFDRVFGMNATQHDVFACARPVIEGVLQGYNGTIFAFGQTASGKTHTIQGADVFEPLQQGVLPRTIGFLFDAVAQAEEFMEFTIKLSCIEIYMERIRDLLNTSKNNLQIRQNKVRGVFLDDVTEEYVASPHEMLGLIAEATANRAVSATGMNEASSRSHCVVTTIVEIRNTRTNDGARVGKLHIVDLAGSESLRRSEATGQTAAETKIINKSLSALGNVIYQLTSTQANNKKQPTRAGSPGLDNSKKEDWEHGSAISSPSVSTSVTSKKTSASSKIRHVSYRDSKLTRLLSESLGGNSRTVLIVCCSPAAINVSETLTSLRFGDRAKRIRNKATVNRIRTEKEMEALLAKAEEAIDTQSSLIKTLSKQNSQLKAKLREAEGRTEYLETELRNQNASIQQTDPIADKNSDEEIVPASEKQELQEKRTESTVSHEATPTPAIERTMPLVHLKHTKTHNESIFPEVATSHTQDAMEVVSLRKSYRELESKLEESQQQFSEKELEVNSLSASLAEAEAVLAEMRGNLNEQQEKAQEATQEAKGHQAKLAAAQKTEEALNSIMHVELKESKAQTDKLQREKKILENQMRDLQDRIEAQHQEHQASTHELRMTVAQLKNKIRTIPVEKDPNVDETAAKLATDLRHQSDDRLFRYAELKFQANELVSTHRQLGRKYAVLDQEYGNTRKLLQAKENKLKQLHASYVTSSTEVRRLRADHAKHSQDMHRMLSLLKHFARNDKSLSQEAYEAITDIESKLHSPRQGEQNPLSAEVNSTAVSTPHVVKPLRGGQRGLRSDTGAVKLTFDEKQANETKGASNPAVPRTTSFGSGTGVDWRECVYQHENVNETEEVKENSNERQGKQIRL